MMKRMQTWLAIVRVHVTVTAMVPAGTVTYIRSIGILACRPVTTSSWIQYTFIDVDRTQLACNSHFCHHYWMLRIRSNSTVQHLTKWKIISVHRSKSCQPAKNVQKFNQSFCSDLTDRWTRQLQMLPSVIYKQCLTIARINLSPLLTANFGHLTR